MVEVATWLVFASTVVIWVSAAEIHLSATTTWGAAHRAAAARARWLVDAHREDFTAILPVERIVLHAQVLQKSLAEPDVPLHNILLWLLEVSHRLSVIVLTRGCSSGLRSPATRARRFGCSGSSGDCFAT